MMYIAKRMLIVGEGVKILPGQTVVGVEADEIPGLLATHAIEYVPDPDFAGPTIQTVSSYNNTDDTNYEDTAHDENGTDAAGNTLSKEEAYKKFERMTKEKLLSLCMDNGIYDLSEENTKAEIIEELMKIGVSPVSGNGTA